MVWKQLPCGHIFCHSCLAAKREQRREKQQDEADRKHEEQNKEVNLVKSSAKIYFEILASNDFLETRTGQSQKWHLSVVSSGNGEWRAKARAARQTNSQYGKANEEEEKGGGENWFGIEEVKLYK